MLRRNILHRGIHDRRCVRVDTDRLVCGVTGFTVPRVPSGFGGLSGGGIQTLEVVTQLALITAETWDVRSILATSWKKIWPKTKANIIKEFDKTVKSQGQIHYLKTGVHIIPKSSSDLAESAVNMRSVWNKCSPGASPLDLTVNTGVIRKVKSQNVVEMEKTSWD